MEIREYVVSSEFTQLPFLKLKILGQTVLTKIAEVCLNRHLIKIKKHYAEQSYFHFYNSTSGSMFIN